MFTALAASIAVRSRGLPPGSPPPLLAATVISRMTFVQEDARRASVTAFFRLICFHLLWPAMAELLTADKVGAVRWVGFRTRSAGGNISLTAACGNAPDLTGARPETTLPRYDSHENLAGRTLGRTARLRRETRRPADAEHRPGVPPAPDP